MWARAYTPFPLTPAPRPSIGTPGSTALLTGPLTSAASFVGAALRIMGGVAGDLFVHLLSGIHYVTGTNQPAERAYSSGGIYYYKDGRDFPDLLWTLYDYPKFKVVLRCNSNNACGRRVLPRSTARTEPW